jgi:hypothetical protein
MEPKGRKKVEGGKVKSGGGGGVSLVVGEDLRVRQIVDLEGWNLVGKFNGRRASKGTLNA